MPSERVQRQIDRLLDEADQAIADDNWSLVQARARTILALDGENTDALTFLAAAERMLAAGPSPGPSLKREGERRPASAASEQRGAAAGDGKETAPGPAPSSPPRFGEGPGERSLPTAFASGRYTVKRFLGEGGKKQVYLAHDTKLDRDVAFALIKTEGLDAVGRQRIQREAQAMGRLGSHPHIVSVFDLGEEDGRPYLVTELMGGGDVEGLLASAPEQRVPLARTLAIGVAVCQGLAFAHGKEIVHRDLKPGNVWLTSDGTAKLGDFGLAVALDRSRLTQAGMMVGTVAYMPPEQALGGEVTPRSDLYSLGAMLYELVTGRPPFLSDDSTAIITQHLNTPPVAPSWLSEHCPPDLEQLILGLLAKNAADRPESAEAVLRVLERIDPSQQSASHSEPGANPLARLAQGVFVGREAELERLHRAFDGAFAGQGRLVMLVGEPGIGKTRTVQELETYARLRGAQTLWGGAIESGGAPPYWPWIQAGRAWGSTNDPAQLRGLLGDSAVSELTRLFPPLAQLPGVTPPAATADPEAAQFALFDAYAQFIAAISAKSPLLLVLDDLHWADKPSLLLLQHLARELSRLRVLVIGTYRDTDLSRTHSLSEALATLNRGQGFTRLVLRGLSKAEVAGYVRATAGVVVSAALLERLHEETEGNPFFLSEVVNLLTQEGTLTSERISDIRVPDGVREALGRRLDRLSPETNSLLQVAAIVGREFSFETVLAAQADADGDEEVLLKQIEGAVGARVIEELPQPGRYRFTHALMQETLLGELSTTRRVRLHGQVGEALERRWGARAQANAPRLASHFGESATLTARHAGKAVQYSKLAAEQAEAQSAWAEAARHYENCLTLVSQADDGLGEDEAALLVALGRCARNDGVSRAAWRSLMRAIDLYRQRDDRIGQAQATLESLAIRAPPERLAALARVALEAVSGQSPEVEARLAVAILRLRRSGASDLEDETRLRQRVEQLVAEHGLAEVAAQLTLADGWRAFRAEDYETALEQTRQAGSALATSTHVGPTAEALFRLGSVTLQLGRLEEGRRAGDEAFTFAQRHHLRWYEEHAAGFEPRVALAHGELARFDALMARRDGDTALARFVALALRWALTGDLQRAIDTLPDPAQAGNNPELLIMILPIRARVFWQAGEPEVARREWGRVQELLASVDNDHLGADALQGSNAVYGAGDALLHLADASFARAALAWVVRGETAGHAAVFYGLTVESAQRQRALIRLWFGELDAADEGLRVALAWCERERCPIEAGRCLQGLAEVAERRGQHAEAVGHLDRAAALFQQYGANLYLGQVLAKKEILKA